MKSCIFLIVLLHLIRTVCCNVTHLSVSTVNLKRPRRANDGYTRWKVLGDEVQTEFIVKVLDDNDVTVPIIPSNNVPPVVGVNYDYLKTVGLGKRVMGGPLAGVSSGEEAVSNEYTRFMPPTRTSAPVENEASGYPRNTTDPYVDIWQFLTPSLPPERLETPVSQLFMPRSTDVTPVQYAPVKPVAFQRQRSDYEDLVTKVESPLDEYNPKNDMRMTKVTRTRPFSTRRPVSRHRTSSNNYAKNNELTIHKKTTDRFSNLLEDNYFDVLSQKVASEDEDDFYHYNVATKNLSYTPPPVAAITETLNLDYNEIDKNKVKEFLGIETRTKNPINFITFTVDYEIHDNIKTSSNNDEILPNQYEDPITPKKPSKQNGKDSLVLGGDFTIDYEDDSPEDDKNVGGGGMDIEETLRFNKSYIESRSRLKRLEACSIINIRPLQFNTSLTLAEVVNAMKIWNDVSPIAKWIDITKGNLTTMENPIYMMVVDDPSGGQVYSAKQTVMIVGGVLGRDHHSVAAAMYFLHRLIDRTDAHTGLLSNFRFWVIPVFNPDGYEYSVTFPEHRNWKKNLHQNWEFCKGQMDMESCRKCEKLGLRCFVQACYGVNLDRNFEYQWIAGTEASEHPCSDVFAGHRQISEVETFAFTNYLQTQAHKLDIFIAFKEGDVLGIMYPFSHTRKKRPTDKIFRKRAHNAVAAIGKHFRRTYTAGQTSEFLPLYAGGIEDWVDGHLNIDLTFAIYMNRPVEQITANIIKEDVVQEVFVGVDALLMAKTVEETPEPFTTQPSGTKGIGASPTTIILRAVETKTDKLMSDDIYTGAAAIQSKNYLFIMFLMLLR